MRNRNKLRAVDSRTFIIPLIIITMLFLIVGNITITSIQNYYYDNMKEESLNLAKSYTHSISKSSEAHKIINGLLEEKILVASRTAALYDGNHSNKLLMELADILEVDEIDYYNSQGELIYSNMEELIGWVTFKGHPVHNFMIGELPSFIGDIRQDSITGNYYKYGYFKTSDGGLIQIGVMAKTIHEFLGKFEMQQIIDEMQITNVESKIYFLDNDFIVLSSTDDKDIGLKMTNQEAKNAILENREYGFINNTDEVNVYEVYVPVYIDDTKIGTLRVIQSLSDTEEIIRQISIMGFVVLSIILGSLFYATISAKIKNKKLLKLAYYDPLTNLPNREYLKEYLSKEITKNKSYKKAILLIQFKNIKTINLTFGFQYGDNILLELANKLRELVEPYKILTKFSTYEFVLYVDNYKDKRDLIAIINKINHMFNSPLSTTAGDKYIETHIGIVEMQNNYNNVDKLLKDVSVSLNNINSNDSINYAFFNEEMESRLQREDLIESELRRAISEINTKKLYLEYQPLVDLKTNQIIGFEALARMKSENLGFVSPAEFIDVAERKHLISSLGNLILKKACSFINTIQTQGYNQLKVAVNISGIQLLKDDFSTTVTKIILENGIKESNLELEITESILLSNYKIINEKLKSLRYKGISIALDDFGTGYSSFSRLSELNIDCVKIDKYFIDKIPTIENENLITGDIISMAHKIGLAVVAEGVELEEQKKYLIEHDCDIMQGYLFSRPLSEENALQILKQNLKNIVEASNKL